MFVCTGFGFRVYKGFGFRFWGLHGFRVDKGSGFRVYNILKGFVLREFKGLGIGGFGSRLQGLGVIIVLLGFRVLVEVWV